jgi:hypothetical protein
VDLNILTKFCLSKFSIFPSKAPLNSVTSIFSRIKTKKIQQTFITDILGVDFDQINGPIDQLEPHVIEQKIQHKILHRRFGTNGRQAMPSPLVQSLVLLKQILLFLIIVREQLLINALLGENLLLEMRQLVAILLEVLLGDLIHMQTRSVHVQALEVELGVLAFLEILRRVHDDPGVGSFRTAADRFGFRRHHRCEFIAEGREQRGLVRVVAQVIQRQLERVVGVAVKGAAQEHVLVGVLGR